MVNGINPNNYPYNSQYNNQFQGNAEVVQKAKEQLKDNYIGSKIAKEHEEGMDPKKWVVPILVALGISFGLKKATTWASVKNAAGKIPAFELGKKLDDLYNNSGFIKGLFDNLGKGKKKLSSLMDKFSFTRTLKNKGYIENEMARNFSRGLWGQQVDDLMEGIKKLDIDDLKKLGLNQKQIDRIKKLKVDYKSLDGNMTGANEADIAVYKEIKDVLFKNSDNAKDVFATLEPFWKRTGEKRIFKSGLDYLNPFKLVQLLNPLNWFKRKTNIESLINCTKALEGGVKGVNSPLSKGALTSGLFVADSVGGVVGGTGALLMNAGGLGYDVKRTMEAPKGEKVKTFMEEFWATMVGFLAFQPLVVRLIGKTDNLKYLGDKDINATRKKLNDGIKEITEHLANKSITKEAYKVKVKELKALKKVLKGKNPLVWAGRLLGRILSVGKSSIPRFSKFGRGLQSFKKFGGSAGRVIIGFMLLGKVGETFAKASHKIFGKPTHSEYDNEEETKKSEQKNFNTPEVSMNDFLKYTHGTKQTQQAKAPAASQSIKATQPQEKPVAAKSLNNNNDENEIPESDPDRTYVPSSVASPFPPEDTSKIDKVIASSDKWAQEAERILRENR